MKRRLLYLNSALVLLLTNWNTDAFSQMVGDRPGTFTMPLEVDRDKLKNEPEEIQQAARAFEKGDYDSTLKLLSEKIEECKNKVLVDGSRILRVSSKEDTAQTLFIVAIEKKIPESKKIVFIPEDGCGSYAYLSALSMVENSQPEQALEMLDLAHDLAPYALNIIAEKGFILNRLARHKEAAAQYERGLWYAEVAKSKLDQATMWRGLGVTQIDLGQLDEAKKSLKKSLKFEPKNKLALHELEYIKHLKSEKKDRK